MVGGLLTTIRSVTAVGRLRITALEKHACLGSHVPHPEHPWPLLPVSSPFRCHLSQGE